MIRFMLLMLPPLHVLLFAKIMLMLLMMISHLFNLTATRGPQPSRPREW